MRFKPPSAVQIPQRVLSLLVGLPLAGALGLVTVQSLPTQNFDRLYSDFVEDNQRLIQQFKTMPPSRYRDETIHALQENLVWAAEYKRTGVDPDAEEMASPP